MTPERWQQVKTALNRVLDARPTLRPTVLENVCSGDAELRLEVESLLAFEEPEIGSFEQSNLSAVILDAFAEDLDGFAGKKIGKYKILREIGVGGMGTVYLAERADGEYEQQVAIKFLRHSFSSKSARARFAQERQILARLQHRFIAQLVDGGTTEDGTPYLAMEYVEGISITKYCAQSNLSINEKLDLFRQVCEAVSFAHRNLIVHRDLKPDNILITADGVPKLLDFGIAKLLSNTEIKATVTRQQALTPEYAAPEQLAGRDITTASDIYALGIILYEILTGTHPFRQHSMTAEQIWKAVVLDEPLRPSAAVTRYSERIRTSSEQKISANDGKTQKIIRKTLKGDLDTIILKSLRKEPERRYDSVERFSQDLKFYLKGFPISARLDTFRYRTGKFFKRNPLASIAVFIAASGLIIGIVVAGYQAHRANLERARAERRFNDVRTLANSFMFEINDKIDESPIKARELIVSRAVEYLDNLAEESGNDDALQSELATSYEKIGDIQSSMFVPSLSKPSESLASHQKALKIRQKLFAKDSNNLQRGLAVTSSLLRIGDSLMTNGNVKEAHDNYQSVIQLDLNLLPLEPQNQDLQHDLARNYSRLGQAVLRSGSLSGAEENYFKALEIYQTLHNQNLADLRMTYSISAIDSYITYTKMQMGNYDEALKYSHESLMLEEQVHFAEKDNKKYRDNYINALLWHGIALREDGKEVEAINEIQRSIDLQKDVVKSDESNTGHQGWLGDSYIDLALTLQKDYQPNKAVEYLQKGIDIYQQILKTDAENLADRRQIALAQRYLGNIYLEQNQIAKAIANYQDSLDEMKKLTQVDSNNMEWRHDLALCYAGLGESLLKNRISIPASENLKTALPMLEKLVQDSPENAINKRDLEKVKIALAKIA